MKAIILAAGQAKRLRPITENLPKTLINIDGETILDHQIKALRDAGVAEIVFVVGFEKEKIIAHMREHHSGLAVTFVENPDYETTGAAYSLWCARGHLADGALYLNSDVLCDPAIIEKVVHAPLETVTAVQKIPWNEEQVNMEVAEDLSIIEIGKHIPEGRSYGEFIGVTKFGADFARALKATLEELATHGPHRLFAADAINRVIQSHGAPAYILDVTGLEATEIDTPEELQAARANWSKN